MSLALIQGYSSAEEEENDRFSQNSSEEDDQNDVAYAPLSRPIGDKPSFDFPTASSGSALPSAFDAFSEISGPPDFLNNCVQEQVSAEDVERQRRRHGGWKNRSEKELPAGAVVKSKAQLVGIHERVRSDIEGNLAPKSSVQPPKGSLSTTQGEGKRVATAANPNAEDAAELLRMCMQCGIPKTYSSARGMVCPQCGDRPLEDANKETDKKKGSTIKEKEKNKRMKGQSSHASWKSETEMHLRQQYD